MIEELEINLAAAARIQKIENATTSADAVKLLGIILQVMM